MVQAERVVDPRLNTSPIGIISSDRSSGTLIAVSPEARQEGIRPGMPASLVQKMSPRTVLLPANAPLYHKVNRVIYDVVSSYCPIVEPGGFGQFYLDMNGMARVYKTYRRAGDLVMQSIEDEASLRSQIGISRNKLVSAITTRVVPERLYTVDDGREAQFLSPYHSDYLPIVGQKPVHTTITDLNAKIVNDVQELTAGSYPAEIIFGKFARQVHHQAYGIDTSAVKPPQIRDHIVEQHVLQEDTNDEDALQGAVRLLAEQVAFQLREQKRVARKAVLYLHYTDGYESRATGSLPHHSDKAVTQELQSLYERANIRRNRVRSIQVDVSDFYPFVRQMDLFEDNPDSKENTLSRELDTLRRKYGFESVVPAVSLRAA